MKILVSEEVVHFHEVELSDELDIEEIIIITNQIKNRYDTGYEAIEAVLKTYKNSFGNAFDYKITPNICGSNIEEINFEDILEE